MKIAEVISTFPPYPGGMGYVCFHNARVLAQRGHEVTVFTLDHERLSYDKDPREFRIVRLKTPLLYRDGGVIPQLCGKLKPFDIVHLHYPFYGGAEYVYLASLFWGQRYFLTYHIDVSGDTFPKKMLIAGYEALFNRRILQRADRIGALTLTHLKSSRAAGLVNWDRVVEVPNGVDPDKFHPREKNRTLLERYGIAGKTVVLFVGNLQPFKGLHLLIDSIAALEDKNVVLLVVGGGYAEKDYRAQVRERGIDDRVIFSGPRSPDEDLPDHYNLGDFLVLPSTHSESFGLVVLEAMASGKPAIVSALPGPSQLVDAGRDGLIAATGDREDLKRKIEYLAQEKEVRENMGSRARDKVMKKYRWEEIGMALESEFESILRKAPRRSS